ACLELNHEEGSARKYILVQLPEQLDEAKNEQKAAYKYCIDKGFPANIAEVCKARIRIAGAEIKNEHPNTGLDIGFKVFRLSNSNIQAWNPDRTDLEETLLSHQDHLIDGRSELDVLYELLLK